jgi:hypothetical protein
VESSLLELCELIAEEGAKYSKKNKELFLNILKEKVDIKISKESSDKIYKIFSFLNWAYVNGIWSTLKNTALRRDLMRQSMNSIVLRTARDLSDDQTTEGIAFLASELDFEFKDLVFIYMDRIKELEKEEIEPDANTATLWGLEWIQRNFDLNDDDMNIIVPKFIESVGDIAKIEEIAYQVNRAVNSRKKGFFSKLFGS